MGFVNLYLVFLPVHSSLTTALQQSLLSPSSQAYIWTILSTEAIVQLGDSFFFSPSLAVL